MGREEEGDDLAPKQNSWSRHCIHEVLNETKVRFVNRQTAFV
jgi:hypothetical protein